MSALALPGDAKPYMPIVGRYRLRTVTGGTQVVSTRSHVGDATRQAFAQASGALFGGPFLIGTARGVTAASTATGNYVHSAADAIKTKVETVGAEVTSGLKWGLFLLVVLVGLWALSTARRIAGGS